MSAAYNATNLLRDAAPAIANHLWQSTAFAVAVAGLAWLLRRNTAGARYWLWMAASLKFLLPLALLAGAAGHLLPNHTIVGRGTPGGRAAAYSMVQGVTSPFRLEAGASEEALRAAHRQPRWEQLTPVGIAAVWLLGLGSVAAAWWVRWRRVAQIAGGAISKPGCREAGALLRVQEKGASRTPLELRLSSTLMEPGVFGVFRPVLLWPAGISERLDEVQLEAVLAHELCHVRRHDNLTAALHMAVQAAFWFHPLVWWLGARLMAERERACDEAALEVCEQPRVYAESLLRVCEHCVKSPLECVAGITASDLKQRVVEIMSARVVQRMGFGTKVTMAALAIAGAGIPVLLGAVRVVPLYGEFAQGAPLPSFEAVTIKPGRPDTLGKGYRLDGRHFGTLNTTVVDLVQFAYGIQARQMDGAPAWADTEKYDITGVAGEGAEDPDWKLMVRRLLAERFGLKFHDGTKEMPVYELQVASNGPKLTRSSGKEEHSDLQISRASSGRGSTIHGTATTMAGLAQLLQSALLDRPVIDRTSLTGQYNFELEFLWDRPRKGGGDAPPVEDEANDPPGIFTAIQELGLKLQPARGPAQVMVVDMLRRPELDTATDQSAVETSGPAARH